MKKLIATILLKIAGWKVNVEVTEEMKHSVMVAAPHTSNWDFPIALMTFWKMDANIKYFIKDNYTKGFFGWFFKWTGAIGVDRTKKNNHLTDYAVELLENNKEIVVLVPAEGTRDKVDKWRTGFYHIAERAKVPVTLGFMDYSNKTAGVLGVHHLVGDFEKDMHHFQEVYRNITAKFPKKYNPSIY